MFLHNVQVISQYIKGFLINFYFHSWSIAKPTKSSQGKTTGGDHLENNLAKFGYILDMKVETKNLSIFLPTYWNLSQKSSNLEILGENLANSGHFFMEIPS
jgi:hypothetical protein